RVELVNKIAAHIGSSPDIRVFGGAINREWFNKTPRRMEMFDFAFDNIVNRFQAFLSNRASFLERSVNPSAARECIGILIEDNNDTIAKKVTLLMRKFHKEGTLFRKIDRIIETPLFVDSELTCMVQVADLTAYAIRRFLDNNESQIFEQIYQRVDKAKDVPVGLKH
ncbi:MAG: DUF3800 domain-containing protein, partial [Elusimicrobia bacterium]|nr:DUF3800 domain-containing protein [Elusimicrobiota bacterium]